MKGTIFDIILDLNDGMFELNPAIEVPYSHKEREKKFRSGLLPKPKGGPYLPSQIFYQRLRLSGWSVEKATEFRIKVFGI